MQLDKLSKEDFLHGRILLIDKPIKWTSFDVVNKIKYALKYRFDLKKIKIGHAGTLDPLATGLLIICVGKKTKSIEEYQAYEKEYSGSLILGATTPSFDLETKINEEFITSHINSELINKVAASFVGKSEQVPPAFSAKRIQGKRAYKIARKGEVVEIKAKEITVSVFIVEKIEMPEVHFNIVCSKGTYIRSIVHDFGIKLKSGAFLKSLRRERIGKYSVNDAISPHEFEKQLFNSAL